TCELLHGAIDAVVFMQDNSKIVVELRGVWLRCHGLAEFDLGLFIVSDLRIQEAELVERRRHPWPLAGGGVELLNSTAGVSFFGERHRQRRMSFREVRLQSDRSFEIGDGRRRVP